MAQKPKIKAISLELGQFPVEMVNETLELELASGGVVLTAVVQKHVFRNHPADYARCLPHVAAVVTNPLFIGDDFKNDGIEMIARVPVIGSALLVAVCIEVNGDGKYEVRSFYPVSEKKIENRLEKGFLKRPQKR